jgi:tetratricopeptide (TPR) repeat protein
MLIRLPKDKVIETLVAIEATIAAAKKEEETLPWNGRHCSVSNSSAIDEENIRALFVLGVEEFAGDPIRAADIGLHLAGSMLRRGYFFDAHCCAKNVAANAEALPKQRAFAHTFLATACAELGELGAVDRHLEEAKKAFEQAGEALALDTLETGLWHAIQSGEVAAGIEWAVKFGDAIRGKPESASRCVETALKIDTWGESMAPVGRAFREAVRAAIGFAVPARNTTSVPAEPFRRFVGTSAELQAVFNQKAAGIMAQAQEALSQGDADQALELLDGLKNEAPDGLPDHLGGLVAGLQIQALGSKIEPAKLDRAMDVQRENMLDHLAFAGLARLESALARQATMNSVPLLAAEILTRRGFVGELCDDPRARASLLFWESLISELRGGRPAPGERSRWARQAARYYGTAEAQLLDREDRKSKDAGPAKSESVAPTLPEDKGSDVDYSEYLRIVRTSDDLAEVDKALAGALRTLSRDPSASPTAAAGMRGERANWLLRMRRYPEAVAEYQTVEPEFRAANDPEGLFTAMAGRARALSRSGKYQDGVAVFEEALKEAGPGAHSANLLVGLAAAHLLEGTERRDPVDLTLIAKAVKVYRQAIDQAPLSDRDRANARLGLARALGEQGEQGAAMKELDRAIAELAHLASPAAKVLIENRAVFVEGGWRSLGLS